MGIAACVAATTARHTTRGACALSLLEDPTPIVEGLSEALNNTLHPGSALSILLARLNDEGSVTLGAMGGTGALLFKAETAYLPLKSPLELVVVGD